MAGKVNALSYMRNVGKSLGYAVIDNITEMNPVIFNLVATTKEQTQNLYHGIKDFKATARDFGNTGPLADAKEIGKDTWNNLLSDLRSGDWYNKARIDKVSEDVMGEAFGIDFDDFGDFDDNFDFDEEFEEKASIEEDSVKKTAQVIDAVGQKTSAAIASASVQSANYIVQNNRANNKALFDLNSKGFSTVITGISSLNSNISLLVEMGKPLTEHMQNSALFYAKTNEYQEQSLALLKQIASNTAPKREDNMRKSSSGGLSLIDLINSDGTVNFSNVKRAAKEGFENSMLGLMTSMLGMMGGVKGAGKMFAASPLQMLLTGATGSLFDIKGSRGRSARDAMGNFNDILSGFLPAMLGKFQAANIDKMKIPDFMKTALRGVRSNLPNSGLYTRVNTANYVKGPVDWDGMSRRALMDVIPIQLSQILSALTGEEPQMFDYKTGRWVRLHSIRKMNRDRTNKYGDQAGGELFSEIRRSIKNSSTMSKRGKKEYDNQIQGFLNQLMLADDADFMRFLGEGDFDFNKYKDYINPELLKDLRARARKLAQSNSKYTNSYARNMYTARASYGKEIRNLGGSGDITESLYNGAFDDLNNKKKRNSMSLHNQRKLGSNNGYTRVVGNDLVTMVDEYDHNIFYYAQELHKDVNFIASNLDMLVAGGRPVGAREEGRIEFKPRIVLRPKETSETARRNIPKYVMKPKKNVKTGDVDEVLNNGRDPKYDGYTDEEVEYIKAKEAGGNKFKYNQKLEDSIKAKEEVKNMGQNVKGHLGSGYSKLKENKYIGKHLTNFENLAGVSTDAVVNILDAASTQINNFMYGTGKPGEESFVDVVKDSFGKMFGQMARTITDLIPQPIKDLFSWFKRRLFDENEHYQKFKAGVSSQMKEWGRGLFKGWGGNKNEPEEPSASGSGLYHFYDRLNREYDSTYTGYSGGGSDYYDYDEPVIIPFNRNRARSRRRRMSGGASGHYRSSDDDAAAGPRRKPSKAAYDAYKRAKAAGKNATDAFADVQADPRVAAEKVISKAANKIADWFSDGLSQIIGNKKPEDEKEKLNKEINSKMRQMAKDAGLNKEALGAGALVGGGLSLITGAFIGPIAGAALGASVAFVSKSESAQKMLFGDFAEETDSKGNKVKVRQGGLLNKKLSNFLEKNAPQMGKGAALGGAAGLLFGSPITGAIIGSAAGYVSSSEDAKKWLFGEELSDGSYKEGKIPKKLQDFIKQKAPWALAGGAAGLMIGPFGPMGNLVAGSMLGLVSQTEGFKKWMFGSKDGKFGEGGFTELIKTKLLNPIVDLFKNMTTAITDKIKEVTHNLSKSIRNFILKRLGARLKKSKIGRAVIGAGKWVAKTGLNIATAPIRGLSNAARKHNIRAGRTAYLNGEAMDAAARNQYREDNMLLGGINPTYASFDNILEDIGGDTEQLQALKEDLGKLYDPNKRFDDQYIANRKNIVSAFKNAANTTNDKGRSKLQKIYNKYLSKGGHITDAEAERARKAIYELSSEGVSEDTINNLLEEVENQLNISKEHDKAKEANEEMARSDLLTTMANDQNNPLRRYYQRLKESGGKFSDTELSRMSSLIDTELEVAKNKKPVNEETAEEKGNKLTEELKDESEKQTGIFIDISNMLRAIAIKSGIDPKVLDGTTGKLEDLQDSLDEKIEGLSNKAQDIIDAATRGGQIAADAAANATEGTKKLTRKAKKKVKKYAKRGAKVASNLGSSAAKAVGGVANGALKGIGKGIVSMAGGGSGEDDDGLFGDFGDDNPDVDSRGEDDTVRGQNGEEQINYGSTEAKENAKNKENFFTGIATIPNIDAGVTTIAEKMDEIAAGMQSGGEGEKKKGLMDTLKDLLIGAGGILGGIIKFFTGNKLDGALGAFGTFRNALSAFIGPAIGTAILGVALSGKLDPLWSKLGLAGKSNKEKGVDSNASWTGMTAKDANGNDQAVAMDEHGKPVMDEEGNYVSTTGEKLSSTSVKYTESSSTDSLSKRMRKSAGRAIGTGAVSLLTGNGLKGAHGAFAATTKALGKSWGKAGTKAANIIAKGAEKNPIVNKIVKKLSDLLGKIFSKIAPKIAKLTGSVSESAAAQALEKFKKKIVDAIKEKAEKSGSVLLKKATEDLAKTALIILKVALILWDFEEGFNNASANWEVAEPTLGQKIGSGVVHVIMNLIPVVGLFIPESLLFNIYGSFILPIFDKEGAAELKQQKADAEAELQAYNEANGTNYTWSEYTKQVKGNYTWGERAWNGVKSFGTNIGNAFSGRNRIPTEQEQMPQEYSGGASGIISNVAKTAFNLSPMGNIYNAAKSGTLQKAGEFAFGMTPMGMGLNAGKKLLEMAKNNPMAVVVQDLHAIRMKIAPDEGMVPALATAGGASGIADFAKKYTLPGYAFDKFSKTEFGQKVSSKVSTAIKGKIEGFAGDISDLDPSEIVALQMNELKNIMRDVKDASIASSVASGASEFIDNVSGTMRAKLSSMASKLQAKLETEAQKVENGERGGFLSKVFGFGKSVLNLNLNETTEGEDGEKKKTTIAQKLINFFTGGDKEETTEETTGSSARRSGGASGMISQRDPKYASMNIGGRSVGDMGCGPASAVNALSALGMHSSMSSAVSDANKYQTPGGTDISYFADEFKKNGASADYVSGRSMIDSVASGKPTVLMGRDSSNTSKVNSPFGPRNHYVVANGINSDGSVNISDPESNGVRRYSPSILNNVSMGVAAGRSGIIGRAVSRISGITRNILSRFSGGASGEGETDSRLSIWRYLTEVVGMTDFGAAGLMGCWQAESGNKPNVIEGYYLKSFPGFDTVTASSEALDAYTTGTLFGAYARSGLSINKSAYLGADGHYYPGFGLAQWTGPRAYQLLQFAQAEGGDWRSLDVQLKYACQELQEKYSNAFEAMNAAGSIEEATTIAFRKYEGCKGHQSWLNDRIGYAKEIYNSYSGNSYSGTIFEGIQTGPSNDHGLRMKEEREHGLGTYDSRNNVSFKERAMDTAKGLSKTTKGATSSISSAISGGIRKEGQYSTTGANGMTSEVANKISTKVKPNYSSTGANGMPLAVSNTLDNYNVTHHSRKYDNTSLGAGIDTFSVKKKDYDKRGANGMPSTVASNLSAAGSGLTGFSRIRRNRHYAPTRNYSAGSSGLRNFFSKLFGKGKRTGFSAGASGGSQETIWRFLTGEIGLTEMGAAGLMGCWQAESQNRSDRIEGDYLKSFPGFDYVSSGNEALNDYTLNKLFPAYANSGLSINKSAYVGADGNYYPGFGLAQWTGPRAYNLLQYAIQEGGDWRNLDTQLRFAQYELETSYSGVIDNLNAAQSVDDATKVAYNQYEGCKRSDWLQERIGHANEIYNTFAGSSFSGDMFEGIETYQSMDANSSGNIINANSGVLTNPNANPSTEAGTVAKNSGNYYTNVTGVGTVDAKGRVVDKSKNQTIAGVGTIDQYGHVVNPQKSKNEKVTKDISVTGANGMPSTVANTLTGKPNGTTDFKRLEAGPASRQFSVTGANGMPSDVANRMDDRYSTSSDYDSEELRSKGSSFGASAKSGVTKGATNTGEPLTMFNALSKIIGVFSSAFTGAMTKKKDQGGTTMHTSSSGRQHGGSNGNYPGTTTHESSSGRTHTGSSGNYPGGTDESYTSGEAAQGDIANNFPYFNQGEEPWGPMSYTSTGNASQTIKTSGCGPTSMAMVMKSYGINTDPSLTAQYSLDHGYRTANSGTAWGFFGDIGQNAGLEVANFSGVETAKQYLDNKIPVIGSMTPGTFTKGGHYIVFSGKEGENVTVNDPASRQRTGNVYDANFALNQAKNFWAVSKDGQGSIGTYGLPEEDTSDTNNSNGNYYTNVTGVGTVDAKGRVVDKSKNQTIAGVGTIDQYGHVVNPQKSEDDKDKKKTLAQTGANGMPSEVAKSMSGAAGSGLIDYRASKAGLKLLRDNSGRFSAGASGDIPSFNGNRKVGLGRFSQTIFSNFKEGIESKQAEIKEATMSKDTAAMLKSLIDLVSQVVTNTATLSQILEVIQRLCSASGNPEMEEAAKGIGNAPSSFVQRTGVNDATLASLNDLRSLVDQVLAS